jgi:hypothetical protein
MAKAKVTSKPEKPVVIKISAGLARDLTRIAKREGLDMPALAELLLGVGVASLETARPAKRPATRKPKR